MSEENSQSCPLGLIETELAVIIILLSVLIFNYYFGDEDEEDNENSQNSNSKDGKNNQDNKSQDNKSSRW